MITRERLLLYLLLLSGTLQIAQSQTIDDFIHKAFNFFRPLVEVPRQRVQEDATFSRPMVQSQRDTAVLGAPPRSALHDVPLCGNGDSKLCSFIACQADNFKNDQSFANLNLAAQVLGDKKLRKAVGDNPEAINAVCLDQGVDGERCAMFTKGFQLINRFINSIEKPIDDMKNAMPPQTTIDGDLVPIGQEIPGEIVQDETMPTLPSTIKGTRGAFGRPIAPIAPQLDAMVDDNFRWNNLRRAPVPSMSADVPFGRLPVQGVARAHGSHTWSSQIRPPPTLEDSILREDWIASLTPPPAFTVAPPTAPPLAFPTVQSIIAPPLFPPMAQELPSAFKFLAPPPPLNPMDKLWLPMKIEPILRFKRAAVQHKVSILTQLWDEAKARVKREDYYDQADAEDTKATSKTRGNKGATGAEEYYDEVDTTRKRTRNRGNQHHRRNCLEILS